MCLTVFAVTATYARLLLGMRFYGSFLVGMESPKNAERLMTPTAVQIAVGVFAQNPPHRWVFVCLRLTQQTMPAPAPAAISRSEETRASY